MKSLRILGYGKDLAKLLEIQEVEKPTVNPNDVLIEIYAASINPIDYKIVEGILRMVSKLDFPAPIGFDVSGIVIEKGSNVKNFEVGDEVYSRVPNNRPGSFAEFIAVDSSVVTKKPATISFNDAASLPLVGLTTIQALQAGGLQKDSKVLIHAGSGGIGSFAIQYAKAKGAYVYTTTSTKNVAWVKALGADEVIDYSTQDYLKVVSNVDIVYDTLGKEYSLDAFKIIRNGGKVISIAGPLDDLSAKALGLNGLIRFILSLTNSKLNRLKKSKNASYRYIMMQPNATQLSEIKSLVEQNKIKPIIDKVYEFKDVIEALKYQASGRAKGKLVVKMK